MDFGEESLDGFVNRPLISRRYGVLLNYEQKLYLSRCHVTFFVCKGKEVTKETESDMID
jgi:hypothetical protein